MTTIFISMTVLAVMITGIAGIAVWVGRQPRGVIGVLPFVLGAIGLIYLSEQLLQTITG